jgi:hypothetical protein
MERSQNLETLDASTCGRPFFPVIVFLEWKKGRWQLEGLQVPRCTFLVYDYAIIQSEKAPRPTSNRTVYILLPLWPSHSVWNTSIIVAYGTTRFLFNSFTWRVYRLLIRVFLIITFWIRVMSESSIQSKLIVETAPLWPLKHDQREHFNHRGVWNDSVFV